MTNTPTKTYELLEARLKREQKQCQKLIGLLIKDLCTARLEGEWFEIQDICEHILENTQRISDIDYILNGVWED